MFNEHNYYIRLDFFVAYNYSLMQNKID